MSDEQDAKRYRFLRDRRTIYLGPIINDRDEKGMRCICTGHGGGSVPRGTQTLDEAIDILMAPPAKRRAR